MNEVSKKKAELWLNNKAPYASFLNQLATVLSINIKLQFCQGLKIGVCEL